jgi:mannan endo-1,4-beta-mannosidase
VIHGCLLTVLLLLPGAATASARTIRLSAKRAVLSGPDLRVAQQKAHEHRRYLTGFSADADTALFHVHAGEAGVYRLFCLCRMTQRKGMVITVNTDGISTILEPGSGSGFSLQYLGIAELVRGGNTIVVHKGWGGFDLASLELRPNPAAQPPEDVHSAPSDPGATPETHALLNALETDYGKTTLLGVYADDDAEYTRSVSGRQPAVMGGDLMRYSPQFLLHSSDTQHEVERLIVAHQRGQVVTLSWHWASPRGARNTPREPWFRSFYTEATTFDVRVALADPHSPEHDALLSDIHQIAIQLSRLQDAGVPVLWRPLHEAEDEDFWWGAKGPEPFQALWKLLYHQLTDVEGIHNLLWVFTSGGDPAWYPGDAYVDIIGIDTYPKDIHDAENALWTTLQHQFAGRRLLTISEFGGVPDLPRMQRLGEWWSYAVSWSNDLGPRKNDPAELKRIDGSPSVGTLPPQSQASPAPLPATAGSPQP